MALEIERKFLVSSDDWESAVTRSIRIRDGLIASSNGQKARVRITDSKATITLKGQKRGLIRNEFEYAIPYSDAEEMLRTMCDGHVLEKVRHFVPHAGEVWSVDVYDGILRGVVIAEIELKHADQQIELPDWIGKEVTNDPRYRKINLEGKARGGRSQVQCCENESRGRSRLLAPRTVSIGIAEHNPGGNAPPDLVQTAPLMNVG